MRRLARAGTGTLARRAACRGRSRASPAASPLRALRHAAVPPPSPADRARARDWRHAPGCRNDRRASPLDHRHSRSGSCGARSAPCQPSPKATNTPFDAGSTSNEATGYERLPRASPVNGTRAPSRGRVEPGLHVHAGRRRTAVARTWCAVGHRFGAPRRRRHGRPMIVGPQQHARLVHHVDEHPVIVRQRRRARDAGEAVAEIDRRAGLGAGFRQRHRDRRDRRLRLVGLRARTAR